MNIGISQDGSKTVIFTRADAIDLLIDAADEDNMPRPTEILREGFKGFSQMTNEELASDIRVFWAAVVDLLVDEFDDALALPMTADAMLDPSIAIRVDADPPWRFDGFTAPDAAMRIVRGLATTGSMSDLDVLVQQARALIANIDAE